MLGPLVERAPMTAPAAGSSPNRAVRDCLADVHVPFVTAALAFGALGGFSLAVSLSVEALLVGISVSWATHAQVHGHLQVIGFAGLFVVGVASKLIPRFGNGHAPNSMAITAAFWCLVAGLLGRSIGQPLATHDAFAQVMLGGALLEVVGALLFAGAVLAVLGSAIRAGAPHALQIGAGALWLVAQAVLGLVWLAQLAGEGGTILRADHDGLLLAMQLFGFLLGVFSGVGLRSFATLFGMPPPSRRLGLAAAALLQIGLLLWVVASLLDATRIATLGQSSVGAGVLVLVSSFGFWRRETRFAAASEPLSWALRGALISLTLTGVLLLATGLGAFAFDRAVMGREVDATRHVFAVGVVTLGIVGMAQLILPEFASERLVRRPSRRRGPVFAAALLVAMLLRVVVPMTSMPDDVRFASMALGGTIAWIAVGVFAGLCALVHRVLAELCGAEDRGQRVLVILHLPGVDLVVGTDDRRRGVTHDRAVLALPREVDLLEAVRVALARHVDRAANPDLRGRHDHVHGDVVGPQLRRHALRHAFEGDLGQSVDRAVLHDLRVRACAGASARAGRDVDDRAATDLAHVRRREAGEQRGRGDVDLEREVEVTPVHLLDRAVGGDAGVVDHRVHVTELRE